MMNKPDLTVVVPIYNEQDNLLALCKELNETLSEIQFEALLVDDGSTDDSQSLLEKLRQQYAWLKVICHPKNSGQSAAFYTGVIAAKADLIATMDGDLQNDSADIPKLIEVYRAHGQHPLVVGHRQNRRDTWFRRFSSRTANHVRSRLLRDRCLDTGCSLKLFRRDDYMLLPQFDHMHRFFPALFARISVDVVNVPVNHRERVAGISKYGLGNRLWVGIVDMFGVRWLQKRGFELSADQQHQLRRGE